MREALQRNRLPCVTCASEVSVTTSNKANSRTGRRGIGVALAEQTIILQPAPQAGSTPGQRGAVRSGRQPILLDRTRGEPLGIEQLVHERPLRRGPPT